MKVGRLAHLSSALTANLLVGAQHLYLVDLSGENLPNLKSTIEKRYPDVKVRALP
jgi:hypothetical protein